jgi:hypothetical protein
MAYTYMNMYMYVYIYTYIYIYLYSCFIFEFSFLEQCLVTNADTLKQLRPIGEEHQELEKRLDQEELT